MYSGRFEVAKYIATLLWLLLRYISHYFGYCNPFTIYFATSTSSLYIMLLQPCRYISHYFNPFAIYLATLARPQRDLVQKREVKQDLKWDLIQKTRCQTRPRLSYHTWHAWHKRNKISIFHTRSPFWTRSRFLYEVSFDLSFFEQL